MKRQDRPCKQGEGGAPCDRVQKGQPYRDGRDCRVCWLFWHEPRYSRIWGGSEVIPVAEEESAEAPPRPAPVLSDCPHFGAEMGETVGCKTCRGRVELKLFACAVYGECTSHKQVEGVACCQQQGGCPGRTARPRPGQGETAAMSAKRGRRPPAVWAYGVTTVPSRRDNLLPQTLSSLAAAGFPEPRLFVDGAENREASWWEAQYACPVTVRHPRIRTFGNWVLGLAELYIREPTAEKYAMFQDDAIAVQNLRQYLDTCTYPDGLDRRPRGYWNLLTFPENQALAPKNERGGTLEGWFPSNQCGRGAVGLVFNREAVGQLLTSYHHIIDRPLTSGKRAWSAIDGGIVDAFKKMGWQEFCHSPSLVRHTGHRSTMGHIRFPDDESFPGESFDALQLVNRTG